MKYAHSYFFLSDICNSVAYTIDTGEARDYNKMRLCCKCTEID